MNIRYDQMVCNQYSLVPLAALESDVRVKAVYLEAMRVQARLMQRKQGLNPEELEAIFLAANRAVVESEGAVRNDQSQPMEKAWNILTESPASSIEALAAYWTGVARGMIPEP